VSENNGKLSNGGILDERTKLMVLNNDGSVSPIVHQFDRDVLLTQSVDERTERLLQDCKRNKSKSCQKALHGWYASWKPPRPFKYVAASKA